MRIILIYLLFAGTIVSCDVIKKIEISAENGKATYTADDKTSTEAETQYVRKGHRVELVVQNLKANEVALLDIQEKDIRIEGDEFQNPLLESKVDEKELEAKVDEAENAEKILSEQKSEIEEKSQTNNSELSGLNTAINSIKSSNKSAGGQFEVSNLNKVDKETYFAKLVLIEALNADQISLKKQGEVIQRKLDSVKLRLISIEISKRITHFSREAQLISNDAERDTLIKQIERKVKEIDLAVKDEKYQGKFHELNFEVHDKIDDLNNMIANINRLNFEHHFYFYPSKEQLDLTVKVKSKGEEDERMIHSITLYQLRRFKIISSIGAHALLIDRRFTRIYANKDSVIVMRDGSNIQPSIGAYAQATWRFNDGLMGFGFGTGIPINIDGSDDLTPNLNVFYTCMFQTDYGRFGFNIGLGIRKVNALAPGYRVGDNIGAAGLDVPTASFWRPGFMFGVAYNIGKNE